MKKTFLGVLVVILLLPSISLANTQFDPSKVDVTKYESIESLEELRTQLLLLIIDLLKIRVQELIKLRDGVAVPAVLGVSTTTGTTTAPAVEERRRSGGGGGGGSSQPSQSDVISDLQKTIADLLAQLNKLEEEQTAIDLLQSRVTELEENLAERDSDIAEYQEEIDSLTNDVETLEEDVTDMSSRIAELESLNQQLRTVITGREADISGLEATIVQLRQQLAEKTTTIATLNTVITTKQSEIQSLTAQLSNAESTQTLSAAEINILKQQIATLQAQINSLTTQLNQLQTLASEQSTVLTAAILLLEGSVAEIASLEALIEQLQDEIADLEEQIEEQEEIIIGGPAADCNLESANLPTGATVVFCTPTDPIIVGKSFPVLVGVDSGDIDSNAALIALQFDTDLLQVDSISKAGSDYTLWTTEPRYSNQLGTIELGGGFANPKSGTTSAVTVYFTPLTTGTTSFNIDASILAADGRGTDIYVPTPPPVYVLGIAPYEATLNISLSADNPDATFIAVDENDTTGEFTILAFNLEAEDGPVFLETVSVRVDTPGGVSEDIIDNAELIINGSTYRYVERQLVDGSPEAELFTFDLDGLMLTEADSNAVSFVVELNAYEGVYEIPQLIKASVDRDTRSGWVTTGYEALDPDTDYFGSAVGDTHTLMGPGVILVDVQSSANRVTDDNGSVGEFEITFEATAFDDDFYFTDNASDSPTTNGLQYAVTSTGVVGSVSAVVSSTADQDSNGVYVIEEGSTETITLSVYVEPSTTGQFRVSLANMFVTNNFNGTADTKPALLGSIADFRTSYILLIGNQ